MAVRSLFASGIVLQLSEDKTKLYALISWSESSVETQTELVQII